MDQRFDFVRRQTSRIVLGRDVAARLPELLGELGARTPVLVHDEVLTPAAGRLAAAIGARSTIALPGGERVKSLAQVEVLASRLRASGADRGTALVAFGGGTIVDLVGFVASVWLRGVPTTSRCVWNSGRPRPGSQPYTPSSQESTISPHRIKGTRQTHVRQVVTQHPFESPIAL